MELLVAREMPSDPDELELREKIQPLRDGRCNSS
jgi:hypothetical protein